MINIDTVYQTVLSIANVEQRGQISPTDFNYFAKQAQLDIFTQNIFDLGFHKGNPRSTKLDIKTANQRVQVFEKEASLTSSTNNNIFQLADDTYDLMNIFIGGYVAEEISHSDYVYWNRSSKKIEDKTSPKFTRLENDIRTYPETIRATDLVTAHYYKVPSTPKWGYVGSNTPVYNSAASTDFELHNTQQATLVAKIIQLAGISMREQDLMQFGLQDYIEDKQIEKQ